MISQIAALRATCRNLSLRNSYVEISKFIRTQHHGIRPTLTQHPGSVVRCFATCAKRMQIEPNERLRVVLDSYKATILRPPKTHNIEILSELQVGSQVCLYGYLGTRRDVSKSLSFALLRSSDLQTCVQLVSISKAQATGEEKQSHISLKSQKEWTPVRVDGVLKERRPAKDDSVFGMTLINDREVELNEIEGLNSFPSDIIVKEDTVFPPEQRHLQIRTNKILRDSLRFRSNAVKHARRFLLEKKFTEVETPMLFKSTPEGAREFIVPTRNKGLAYALPQSPQQYKQIVMASGIPMYFQFARCFRDEDLRADRQPEFTQLDIEMAFAGAYDVMHHIEELLKRLWFRCLSINLQPEGRFPHLTYHEAMASYGSDKPDLRLGMEIHRITKSLIPDLISKITPLQDPVVEAFRMKLPKDPKVTREFISNFLDSPEGKPFLDNLDGQPGIFICDRKQPLRGLAALGHEFAMKMPDELSLKHGELLVLQARKNVPFSGGSTSLGNLRLALHKAAVAQGLIGPPKGFKFVWIIDFPLFSPSNDIDPGQGGTAGLSSTHHPFTAPKTPEDVELLLESPEKVVAAHYDIVVNGVELGGGSRRIHNAEVQEFILRDVLKMSPDRLEDFRHLLEVLRSGCPPHAGIALGWDRLIAVMLGNDSVRDVIAFPKSGKGEDLLVKSPNAMTKEQLDTYHLQFTD